MRFAERTSAYSIGTALIALTAYAVCQGQNSPAQLRAARAQRAVQLLSAHCFRCHGPDRQEAGLRLDRRDAILKGGFSGAALSPFKPVTSRIIARLTGKGGLPTMPMGFAPLLPAQIATIRSWIAEGADYPNLSHPAPLHWAYVKPVPPAPPHVREVWWVRNPIDSFILQKIESAHLKPSPVALRRQLIRRLSLDIIGLPPTPTEVTSFVEDRAPNAYEKLVDRLLASPHYGEKWASQWLDLARYADTNGYEKDLRRTVWPYRDWVVSALNTDMGYDEFTVDQLAGDMLPNATEAEKVASGFNRNTLLNEEGGVDPAEARWLTVVDRVATTSITWLGTTLQCAECHNHKYDPFTQEDYYRMFAFFRHSEEPSLELDHVKYQARRDELQKRLADAELHVKQQKPGSPDAATAAATVADIQAKVAKAVGPNTLVFSELNDGKIPSTWIRVKGSYLTKDRLVTAGTPPVLNPWPAGVPLNRLGLARWIVSPDNPLTARVEVNRIWQGIFGTGIVATVDDLGTQGSEPTHARLLDWLATQFMARRWSIKSLIRQIVTSAAYMQQSTVTPLLQKRDPENSLLARSPRFRLDAELVRDNDLEIAGMLSATVGGPSVFPLQPEGIWNVPYNDDKWVTSPGENKYRRGVYTFWRRSAPYPEFGAFDAPSREYCTARRVRTNTPLQALTTLNDPGFMEFARGLGARMVHEGGITPEARISYGFNLCCARDATGREVARLAAFYRSARARLMANPTQAKALSDVKAGTTEAADMAAWTMVANIMLNLDETLTRE